ncbi:MAG: SixA phosphatase family protein, partial [Bacteroidales bacterium]
MKRLIFMRHGKAESQDPGLSDFERSLTLKGKNLSHLMSVKLKEKISKPGLLISSPAFRALETALIFALEYDIKPEAIIIRSEVYYRFNEKTLLSVLESSAGESDSVVFFGHDPSFTNLANFLSGNAVGEIPKSGIVC